MSEIGFGSIFPAGLFDVQPGTPVPPQTYEPGEHAGPEPPAVVNVAPGVLNQAVPQGDSTSSAAPAGSTDTVTTDAAINHGFGLILLLVLIVLGLWLLFRSGQ